MTSNNNIIPLFPQEPNAIELWEDDTNQEPQVSAGIITAEQISELLEQFADANEPGAAPLWQSMSVATSSTREGISSELHSELADSADIVLMRLAEVLSMEGHDIHEDPKGFCFAAEAVLSTMYKNKTVYHPIQSLADDHIQILDEDLLTYVLRKPEK